MKKTEILIKYSEYQMAIFDWISRGTGNAIVSAVAGSGKTTTIIDALSIVPEGTKSLFLSFNKEIQKSTRKKMDKKEIKGVTVSTNHGFGYNLIMGSLNFIKPDVKDEKYDEICNQLFVEERKVLENKHKISFAKQEQKTDEVRHSKQFRKCFCSAPFFRKISTMLKFVDFGRMFCLEDVAEISDKIKYMGQKYDESIKFVDIETVYQQITKTGLFDLLQVDYLDMLWIPVQKNIEMKQKFDFIFLDECQDLNAAQIKLVQHAINQTGARLLAVGDPQQAIYGFAGALPNAWHKVKESFRAKEFPLSVCYRCGREIVNLAKSIVPQISPSETAISGEISHIEDFSIQFILKNVDAVLSRFFAPLVHVLCVGIPISDRFRILGLDFSQEMKRYILTITKETKKTSEEYLALSLREKIQAFFAEKMESEENDFAFKKLEDVMNSLLFFEKISDHTENGMLTLIEKYMTDKPKRGEILLSTIHKAKGQEWNSVLVLGYNQMPHHFQKSPEWQDEQERNLQYIAITRAKKTLYQHCPQNKFWYREEFVFTEETSKIESFKNHQPKESHPECIMDEEDEENLYQIERERFIAKGSTNEVPKWARPALKYILHPKLKGANLALKDLK